MKEKDQNILKKIKNGSYFKDALEWYNIKYLSPVFERSALLIIAIFVVFGLAVISFNINSVLKEEEPIPIIIKVKDSTSKFSFIKSLDDKGKTTQIAVSKYLLEYYVTLRENYSFSKTEGGNYKKLIKKVKSTSTKPVFTDFENYIRKTNPNGPIIKYGRNKERIINIEKIKFDDNNPSTGKAKIFFTSKIMEKGKSFKKNNWQADVHFRIPDIETIAKTKAPLRFLVSYYKVKNITQN